MLRALVLGLVLGVAMLTATGAAAATPLALEATIPLPHTSGRIDHLAVDPGRKHLFVAELGNGTVDVVDLGSRKVVHRIEGLKEPQGIAYAPRADVVAVAGGGDGALRLYDGGDFRPRGVIRLGDDADNVRLDPRNGDLVVGYGDGALAVIDPVKGQKLRVIALPGHPESFRLDGSRVFINVPDAGRIMLADLDGGRITGQWRPDHLSANFPMILDGAGHVAVVFRAPPRLVLYDGASGKPLAASGSCGDADDVFFDKRRKRFYVSCGAGKVDVFAAASGLTRLGSVDTSRGARTSLFVPELDRLFVAERAGLIGSDAAIAVFAPQD